MKNLQFILVTVLLLISSNQVIGGTAEQGPFTVSSLRFAPDGLYVQLNPAPTSCGGGDQYRMHAKVSPTRTNYKELTSALLTAYTANQSLMYIWIDNVGICSNTHVLDLYMVEFMNK